MEKERTKTTIPVDHINTHIKITVKYKVEVDVLIPVATYTHVLGSKKRGELQQLLRPEEGVERALRAFSGAQTRYHESTMSVSVAKNIITSHEKLDWGIITEHIYPILRMKQELKGK